MLVPSILCVRHFVLRGRPKFGLVTKALEGIVLRAERRKAALLSETTDQNLENQGSFAISFWLKSV